jgi:hypothetical protein
MAQFIPNIEEIEKLLPRCERELFQAVAGRVASALTKGALILALAVPGFATEEKGIQMVIVPAEGALNGGMQVIQRLVACQLDAPPD